MREMWPPTSPSWPSTVTSTGLSLSALWMARGSPWEMSTPPSLSSQSARPSPMASVSSTWAMSMSTSSSVRSSVIRYSLICELNINICLKEKNQVEETSIQYVWTEMVGNSKFLSYLTTLDCRQASQPDAEWRRHHELRPHPQQHRAEVRTS